MSINRATLEGYLGQDPEIHQGRDGTEFSTFRLATSEQWTDKSTGEKKERSDWHYVVVFSDWFTKNIVKPLLRKGSRVAVEGKLETREYEKDGTKRYVTEVIVRGGTSRVSPINWPKGGTGAPPPQDSRTSGGAGASTPRSAPAGRPADLDDDIPF